MSTHILNLIPNKKVPRDKVKLPRRSMKGAYDEQASLKGRKFVPEKYQSANHPPIVHPFIPTRPK